MRPVLNKVSLIPVLLPVLRFNLVTAIHPLFDSPSHILCGPGSSVGIATDYGLDGAGSSPGGDEIFRLSRPALGSTQPPVKWVPGLSRGLIAAGKCC